jgi:hypothetical protein
MVSKRTTFANDHALVRGTIVSRPVAIDLPRVSTDLRPWVFIVASLCLATVLAFVQLSQASYVSRQVEEMSRLESDLLATRQRNNTLRLQIAEARRMPRLMEQARALGLTEAERVDYVTVSAADVAPMAARVAQISQSHASTDGVPLPSWLRTALLRVAELVGVAGVQPQFRSG